MLLRKSLFIFCFLLSLKGFSQSARFRHLTIDDGLSMNMVNVICQDSLGFIWVATADGLNRYDGKNVTVYSHSESDTNTLSGGLIRGMCTQGNYLWIGVFGSGLDRMDLRTGKIRHYYHKDNDPNSLSDDFITSVKSHEGKIYIGTNREGISVLDPASDKFSFIRKDSTGKNGLLSSNVRDIFIGDDHVLWAACKNGGVTAFDLKKMSFEQYRIGTTDNDIHGDFVRTVFKDSRGLVWVSLWSTGTDVIDTRTKKVYSNRDTSHWVGKYLFKAGLVSQYMEDSKGNIWIATAENGLLKFNPETDKMSSFANDPNDFHSINDNAVFCMTEDRSGIIWAGTWRGGVNIFDPKTQRFGWYSKVSGDPNSLHNNFVYSFCPRKNSSQIFVGTAASITVFDTLTGFFKKLPIDTNDDFSLRPKSAVYCMAEAPDGKLWSGTSGGGLYSYDPVKNKYRNYVTTADEHSLSFTSPSSIFFDRSGKMYVATYGGGINIFHPDKDNFDRLMHDPDDSTSLSQDDVAFVLDDDGYRFWIGTNGGGLDCFDAGTGQFKHYRHRDKDQNSLINDAVISLLWSKDHRLIWVGTSEGLCRFDPATGTFTSYTGYSDYLKQEIISMLQDKNGDLWLATRKGLLRFNTSSFEVKVYTAEDGLQGNEYRYKAFYADGNGQFYFGGLNGMNRFDPLKISDNASLPAAVFTGITVLGKPYNAGGNISYIHDITLSYRDYFFAFSFAGLEFTDPSRNSYQYKLEGFNDSWVDIGNVTSVTFTNLDPGEYVLKVKAANNDGKWNENAAEIRITIAPPFWRTKWFYALCILSLIGGVYAYIRWRERKLLEEKAVLEDAVQLRTYELRIEKEKVEAAHKDITDSINYASKIQSAILPEDKQWKNLLQDSFILFHPKDVVSGDFYWIGQSGKYVFYATADCTGHGVPGGFMTMLGTSLLNEIIIEKKITDPGEVLNELREKIISSLKQTGATGESKDGMDMVLCRLDLSSGRLVYSGANNSLYIVRKGAITEYKPDKQPIGFAGTEHKPFSQHEIALEKGDMVYTFTDGYADQFGGEKGKKFKYRQLENILLENASRPVHEQKKILDESMKKWKGNFEQVDDILVIGVRVGE